MEDVELVLRFFAYRRIASFKPGLNKITELLDRFLVEGNKYSEDNLKQYRSMFENTVDFLWKILEKEAFAVLGRSNKRPTKIVYDPLMFTASNPDVVSSYADLIDNKDVLREKLSSMYMIHEHLFAGRSTNRNAVLERNNLMRATFLDSFPSKK
jgi:hypothetical protein